MDISYANSRIRKICTDAKVAQKELGKEGVHVLQERLRQMRVAENLETLRFAAGDWHELKGDRKIQEVTWMNAGLMMRHESDWREALAFAMEHPEIPAYLGGEIINRPKKKGVRRKK